MARVQRVAIQVLGFDQPVAIAAAELAEYLGTLAPVKAAVRAPLARLPAKNDARIVLGTSDHLKGLGLGALPKVSELDDALAIIPKKGKLYLAGANPRSVLFAVYRLLEELGAVFLRPGPGGEVLPRRGRLALPRKAIREKASYRHRGICIEGAPRLEHVLGVLDWMAKKKMNSFQLQFRHSGVFWRRGHESPEVDEATRMSRLSEEDCFALDERVIARCRELGFVVHRVGHGWTAFALGLPGYNWEQTKRRPAKGKKSWPAEVSGKREIWDGKPVNTELCYGRREIREAVVEEVVAYARRHSEVDVLHVWMSDALNNKCECKLCAKKPMSDWYAMMMNAIGRRLKEEGLSTRALFLAYVDLLWPPARERITEDNVVFMYAPITRCYRHALTDAKCDAPHSLARPKLNQYEMPRTNRPYAEIAGMWKNRNLPDTFVFDYHMMWAVWQDGFGMDVGSVMAQDMKDLERLGLDGLVSCQCTRAFYPLPYTPNAMADLLWNKRASVGEHRRKIMKAAFGPYAREVESYFAKMVGVFTFGDGHEHKTFADALDESNRGRFQDMVVYAREHRKRFGAAARAEKDPVIRTSLGMLGVHAEHAELTALVCVAALDDDRNRIKKLLEAYRDRLPGTLRRFAPWIDPLVSMPIRGAAQKILGEGTQWVGVYV